MTVKEELKAHIATYMLERGMTVKEGAVRLHLPEPMVSDRYSGNSFDLDEFIAGFHEYIETVVKKRCFLA